jgi:hypothetical protein
LLRDNQPVEARLTFKKVGQLKPDYAFAQYYLGKILAQMCQVEMAAGELKKAIKYQAAFRGPITNRSRLHFAERQGKAALRDDTFNTLTKREADENWQVWEDMQKELGLQ